MRLNDFDSLVNEKLTGPEKYDRCYCVAIAGAAATVVSAGAGVYASTQAGKSSGGGGSKADLYGSKIEMPEYKNNVDIPKFDAASGGKDLTAMLPQLLQASKTMTKGGINARNQVMSQSSQIMEQGGKLLTELGAGAVPQDVIDSTNRIIAERFGGAHTAGSNADQAQTAFARNIGQTSQNQVNTFLSAAPTWEQLADSFAYTPEEAAGTAINLLSQRYNYALGAGQLQKGIDENQYSADLNSARGAAAPNPQAVGARNDALLQQSMQGISGGNSNYLTAIGGVVNGLSGALKSYQSTQPNASGFYGTADAAIKATGASTAGYYAGAGGPSGGGGYYAY